MLIKNNIYAETKRIIRDAMKEHQLVLFVGAGISSDSGIPLWSEAISVIAERLNIDLKENKIQNESLVIPQYYYNSRGYKEYNQLMRDIFRYNDVIYPTEIHNMIMRFETDTIITTNYDHLIEQAAEANAVFLQVISKDADLPYRKAGRELIKMHGDFENNNFVLREEDYLYYHKNFKLIENYVKSIIGSKTILFIGYSLSDPDVKHIISWAKEILDEHFQRAYLIIVGRKYNQNEYDYYRHLGINLIYPMELIDETKIGEKEYTKQLSATLRYFLDEVEDKTSINIEDNLYNNLKAFTGLNYTYGRYIAQAFYNLYMADNTITLRIGNDGYIKNTTKHYTKEENVFLQALVSATKGDKVSNKIQTIYEVMVKSNIRGIILKEESNKHTFHNFPLPNFCQFIEAIKQFDYKMLIQIRESNSRVLSEDNPILYLQQAYISVYLSDYISAYYYLKSVIPLFYRKKEYAWYFISLWNKKNIAKIILEVCLYRNQLDKETIDLIQDDYNRTDLEKTLNSISDLGNNNRFLRDLRDFKFASDLFYDVVSNSVKSGLQASEQYLFVTDPAYAEMQQQVYDYYNYVISNYLIVDAYRENNEIYNLFARGIFSSISAPDKVVSEENSFFYGSHNVHLRSLNENDIHLILRYIDIENLKKLFNEFGISIIETGEKGKEYFQIVEKNLFEATNSSNNSSAMLYWKLLILVSHTKIELPLAVSIMKNLVNLKDKEYYTDKGYFLNSFVNALYLQKLYDNKELCSTAKELIKKLLVFLSKNPDSVYFYQQPITLLLSFCNKGDIFYDDELSIKNILSDNYSLLLTSIYFGCQDSIKITIKDKFAEWICPDEDDGYQLYINLVLNKIIDPSSDTEKKAFDYLKNEIENKRQQQMNGITAYSSVELLRGLINLYLMDSLINVEELKTIVSFGDDKISKWLINVEEYNYNDFELAWLNNCYPPFLKKLSESNKIRKEVVLKYKDSYFNGGVERRTSDIVLKYFL